MSFPAPTFAPAGLPFRPCSLAEDEVHLWLLELAQLPAPMADPSAATPDHGSRLVRRFYLRLLLAAYLGRPAHTVKLAKTPNGKPYIAPAGEGLPPPLYFSLSHHAGQLLIAVCHHYPVGVDLEGESRRLRQPLKLAKRYFHPSESAYLEQLPEAQLRAQWLTIWTCKEAVVKATGGGIVSGLHHFAVLPGTDQPQLTAAVNAPQDDVLHQLKLTQLRPLEGMLGALACARDIACLKAWRLAAPGAR